MSEPLYAILIAISFLGWWMFARGRRGRRIDDHPVCAKCGFDLVGRPKESFNCPECGINLRDGSAIKTGNRQRREGLMYAGLALAIFSALPLVTTIGMAAMNVDTIRIKPFWWLLRDATQSTNYFANRDCEEIFYRIKNDKLSLDDDQKVVDAALGLQANMSKPWNPRWGDIIELLQSKGRLSKADWQKYLSQDEPATLEVRPKVARGDPISYHLHGELRGGMLLAKARPMNMGVTASVPGCVVQYQNWVSSSGGNEFGFQFDITGNAPLTDTSWEHLHPGTQLLLVNVTGIPNAVAANPGPFGAINRKGYWDLLNDGQKSVQLYADEALAAQVQKTLFCEVNVDSNRNYVSVLISWDNTPVNLALDVSIRTGGKEWDAPGYWVCTNGLLDGGGTTCIFSNAQQLIGHRADVVLRPSMAAAARTVNMDRLLDHEFVFKDVLIDNKK